MNQEQALKALRAQYEAIKGARQMRIVRVEAMRKYTLPHKSYLQTAMLAGDNPWYAIYDNLGQTAAGECAANLFTHMCPSDEQWFLLAPPAADAELSADRGYAEQLASMSEQLFRAMAQTNWATEGHSACEDLMDGTCCVEVGDDPEPGSGRPFALSTLAMNEFAFACDAAGRPHTVFTEVQLTAYEAAKRWGLEKLPEALRRALEELKTSAYSDTRGYLNIMRPNERWDPSSIATKASRYESLWLDPAEGTLLERRGLRRLRRVVARFKCARGQVWGFGPTDAAYGCIRGLDKAVEIWLKYGAMKMNPPSIWPDDGAFWPQDATPGAIIVGRLGASDKGQPSFLEVQGDHRIGQFILEYLTQAVTRAYMTEAFQILRDSARDPQKPTAMQVAQLLNRSFDIWGPPLWRIKQELIDPLVLVELEMLTEKRLGVTNWMYGGQALPDYRYDLRMISPLFLALQLSQIQRLGDAYLALSPWAEIDPAVWDTWSLDDISHAVQDVLGIPTKMRRSQSSIRQIREARAQLLAQREAVEQAKLAAEASSKLSVGAQPNSPMEMALAG